MFSPVKLLDQHYQFPSLSRLSQLVTEHYIVDENALVQQLINYLEVDTAQQSSITSSTETLVERVRNVAQSGEGVEAFLQQYSLDTHEGILLMCLAEALLRIPDAATADALIQDKLAVADWKNHLSNSDSILVNASTWGLLLTGKVIKAPKFSDHNDGQTVLSSLINKLGEPIVRKAMYAAMKIMGKQFVLGRNIKEALKRSRAQIKQGYTHSYDMLGEAALTADDAEKYYNAYYDAITAMANNAVADNAQQGEHSATISIKLSALHPRYEESQRDRVLSEMRARVVGLLHHAIDSHVGVNIDAEEADRLELSLALMMSCMDDPRIRQWGNLGFVVQAYSKRALPVLMMLTELAKVHNTLIPIRLVKGAYWDYEIKHCQELGVSGYPVYTRKAGTDVSYLACAKYLLSDWTKGRLYPQFATHNAQTVSSIQYMAGKRSYEFQRLHGMGEALYQTVIKQAPTTPVRIYAPVGAHEDLLPYLVRRLLENGANSSFVHKLVDPKTPISLLTVHPVAQLKEHASYRNTHIPLPEALYSDRQNSRGVNTTIHRHRSQLLDAMKPHLQQKWQAKPIIQGRPSHSNNEQHAIYSPFNTGHLVGHVQWATKEEAEQVLTVAKHGYLSWRNTHVDVRAAVLERMADLIQAHSDELLSLCCLEAGKTIEDGIAEIREAIDFCRYYAVHARQRFAKGEHLQGPTGETNQLTALGKGVFVCISPWNFPLAIFLGQVAAAIVTGNSVIAKPAEQTSLIAYRCVELLLQAGAPADVIQYLPGTGTDIGAVLTQSNAVAGVCFTGSTRTAQLINLTLAQRQGAIATLIAETGGQNAMIVDSTSLPEQVVSDAVTSAFSSAGQRCSALRVLYVQEDIADNVITLLKGALNELVMGDPLALKTDVGPVIDATAKAKLEAHINTLKAKGQVIAQLPQSEHHHQGYFVAPTIAEIESINELSEEHFGPILHVIRYSASALDDVINDINNTGFGLTLGIHTRNESLAMAIAERVNVGNIYINRNQIGATVGVQPFGGQGLSGTGPKAGGPLYLDRFVTEKTITNNITSMGGNTQLLRLGDTD